MPVLKIKNNGVWENISGASSQKNITDTTLTQEGVAADAKAVGEALDGKAPAGDYATESFVTNKIAEAQLSGGEGSDIDLSGYATKDDLNNIDFPVDSVNGKVGAVKLTADDIGASASSHKHAAGDIVSGALSLDKGGTGTNVDLVNAPANAIIRKAGGTSNQLYYTASAKGAFYAAADNGAPQFGILPVEMGGTEAKTADGARANLKAIRVDLLWTNASPSSEFPEQTITVNGLSDYDMYIVLARHYTDVGSLVSAVGKTGWGVRIASVGATSTTTPSEWIRTADYLSGGKLKFYAGRGNGGNTNNCLIPHFIYGVKGVQ